ncbi:alpha,alpha-trehalose-phosphate synthase (UDP-forming) [Loktanella sp. M215]|uniref:alpha,alpha-trehalose-phosphate synthase (UDP-forming) n=1 Tax=Loktanella sp. M215 TaxID=2675431 RepID=UPI001F0184CA|nr:trehalose-6-phosphate synthase [Loktanella sp. M215]MCF7699540.1 trehalose-6-phosphate synthase [Loktanella sp. M215]
MTGRLIVVSNRVPSDGPPAGGLVVALHECLTTQGGIWYGTSGEITATADDTLTDVPGDSYDMRTFDLTQAEHEGYYLGYANSVLWPLCHRRADLMALNGGDFESYLGVNRRLAKMMARDLQPDDQVWIHDYHFLPLAACLRAEGVTATLGYFHHIPFPAVHDLMALPEHDIFPQWIASFDLVGLQTQRDVAAALEMYRSLAGAEQLRDGSLRYRNRGFEIRSFPIGIDAAAFAAEATRGSGRDLLSLAPDERLVIGVDRLDYSKGLDNRLRAFGRYLEARRDDNPRASLLQIAPPTREEVAAYQNIRSEMERITGKVNGLHSDLDWTPIRYIHRGIPRDTLASLYRAADVGFVTPFCDGMNLVAKEYVAAQDPDDPGVLILSQFAGAAEQMAAALIVNPYDIGEMAEALRTALAMPLEERRERHAVLLKGVMKESVGHWTDTYLATMARLSATQTEPESA